MRGQIDTKEHAMTQPPQDPNQPYGQQPQQPYGQQPPPQPYGQPQPGQFGPPPGGYQPTQQPEPAKKKAKKWPWIVGAIVVVIIIASVAGGKEEDKTDTATATSTTTSAVGAPASAGAPVEAAPKSTIPPLVAAPKTGNGKVVTYEVISDSGSLNSVTWFDENNALQQDSGVTAPWSLTVNNNSSFITAGVTAQTDGTSVTCRVTVDGKVEEENTSTGQYAVVNCTSVNF
jgi:hypothetical protein